MQDFIQKVKEFSKLVTQLEKLVIKNSITHRLDTNFNQTF